MGRHSIELAYRGYLVTGFDLSQSQLDKAGKKAKDKGVSVALEQRYARRFSFPNEFQLAIMICEGAFPLMEPDEMNF